MWHYDSGRRYILVALPSALEPHLHDLLVCSFLWVVKGLLTTLIQSALWSLAEGQSTQGLTSVSPAHVGFEYFEASAKDNINVKQTFERLVDVICERMSDSLDNADPTVTGGKQGPQLSEQPQRSSQDCAC